MKHYKLNFKFLSLLLVCAIIMISIPVQSIMASASKTPMITLNGNNEITLEVGTSYAEEGAIALDDVDGDLSEDIVISGDIDTSVLGDYTIYYEVSDMDGNTAEETRVIHVVDTTSPMLALNGEEDVELTIGDTYTEEGALAIDNYDGDISDNIEKVGTVDNTNLGEYPINYLV
ncbi:immunoglobulin-like domain-containing protein, partial [Sporosalibacterium faouarense]|uniref:immunoglobulin-like domain-containing protein n=1 Tax=Sporosalibacterium faouarense TaxID=516123 RepID=UPI00192B31D9